MSLVSRIRNSVSLSITKGRLHAHGGVHAFMESAEILEPGVFLQRCPSIMCKYRKGCRLIIT